MCEEGKLGRRECYRMDQEETGPVMFGTCAVLCQVPITDVYGPTAWDGDLQCLVVTMDTARGGEKLNIETKQKVSYQWDCVEA